MVQTLPIAFNVPNEGAVSTYNYQDIADGTGYVILYGSDTEDSTGTEFKLNSQIIRTYNVSSVYAPANTASAVSYELNFDLSPFNTPRTAKGTAILELKWTPVFGAGGGNTTTASCVVNIMKYDGSTETTIGTITTQTYTVGDGYAPAPVEVLFIDLTQTNFKIGENLRLNLIGTVAASGVSAGKSITFYHDPEEVTTNTQLKFYMPFKIEL